MPVTIKTQSMKYRNPDGTYTDFNAVAHESTNEQIAIIETAGAEQVQAVESAATVAIDAAESARDDAIAAKNRAVEAETNAAQSAEQAAEDVAELKPEIDRKAPAIYESIGPSAIASFADGAEDMPIKTLTVEIPVTQAGSGDPAPDNVRPISGWTGVEVQRTGMNVWDEEWEVGGYYNATGLPWRTNDRIRSKNYIPIKPETSYYTTIKLNALCYYDENKNYIIGAARGAGPFTTPANAHYMRFATYADYGNTYNHDISINYPTADHDYHSGAENTTYPITFPTEAGAVYAGTLTIHADGSAELSALPHYASYAGETLVGPWVSSMDVYAEGATPTTGAEVVDLGGAATVYQLTAEQIKALGGTNNVWSNAGNVAVEYPADTKSYIDEQTAELSGEIGTLNDTVDGLSDTMDALQSDVADTQSMIATVETSETASKDYAVGDLLVLGGLLYKVVSAITLGSTIIPDGNVEQTTVEAQIAASGGGGDLHKVFDVTLTSDVVHGGEYVTCNLPKPTNHIFVYVNTKPSTAATTLDLGLYNANNVRTALLYFSGVITTSEKHLTTDIAVMDNFLLDCYAEGNAGQIRRRFDTILESRAPYSIAKIEFNPHNELAPISTGSRFVIFA